MKKFLSAILALVMALSVCPMIYAAEAADGTVDSGIVYEDSTVTFDTAPGRGIGRYYWIEAYANGTTASYTEHPSGLSTPMYDLSAFSAGNDFTHDSYSSANPSRVGGEDVEINEQTLDAIRKTFETARKLGVQCIPRFAYEQDGYVGAEPAELETIIMHIEQLSEILNEYKDIVIAIEGGMIGPWGEMHSSKYAEKDYANAIIGAWVENLDESIMVLLRNPTMVINYSKRMGPALIKDLPLNKDHAAYRIGMYNDGYLGTDNDYGTWGVGLTRKQGVEFLNSQAHIPYGGEMAHTTVEFLSKNNSPIYKTTFIKELYDSHLSYLRNLTSNSTGLQTELERLRLTEDYDFEGMPDYSAYYGQTLQKFMLDHMGYRFVLRDARLSASVKRGDAFRMTGKVENVGFGNLLGKVKSEVLLVNEKGEKVYIPVDIDPHAWLSCTTSTYDVTVTIPKDAAAGKYTAYLRFSSVAGEDSATNTRGVPFANEDVYEQKYNANNIGTFTVEEEVGGVADGYKQVYVDFTDVKDNHWAKDNIRQICISGLMGGMGAGKFAPEGTATRAQLVTILYRMEGSPDMGGLETPLTDIDGWYKDAITWAYSEKIVNGVTPTTFAPNTKLNRETFATMLFRYVNYTGVNAVGEKFTTEYTDEGKVSSWALEAMKWANANGLIGGMTATTLVPQGNATRAQMATILFRYIESSKNVVTPPEEEDPFVYYDLSRLTDSDLTAREVCKRALANANEVDGEAYGDPMTAIYAVDHAASFFEDMDIFGYGVTVREMCGDGWGGVDVFSDLIGNEDNYTVDFGNMNAVLRLPMKTKEDLLTCVKRDVDIFGKFLDGEGDPYVKVGDYYKPGLDNITDEMLADVASGSGATSVSIFTSERFNIDGNECGLSLDISTNEEDGVYYYRMTFMVSRYRQ